MAKEWMPQTPFEKTISTSSAGLSGAMPQKICLSGVFVMD
jgi:hypothetical protein